MFHFFDAKQRRIVVSRIDLTFTYDGFLEGPPTKVQAMLMDSMIRDAERSYGSHRPIQYAGIATPLPPVRIFLELHSHSRVESAPYVDDFDHSSMGLLMFMDQPGTLEDILHQASRMVSWDDHALNQAL